MTATTPKILLFGLHIEYELPHGCGSDCHHEIECGEVYEGPPTSDPREVWQRLRELIATGEYRGDPITAVAIVTSDRDAPKPFEWIGGNGPNSSNESLEDAFASALRYYDPRALHAQYRRYRSLPDLHQCPLCGCAKDNEPEFANRRLDSCGDDACPCHDGEAW